MSRLDGVNWMAPLFDNHGNRHSFVILGAREVITRSRGRYRVWSRDTGQSLMSGEGNLTISNSPPETKKKVEDEPELEVSFAP